MDNSVYLILLSVTTGYACYYAYKEGIKEGVNSSLKILHQQKIIAYDNKGEIYPNPFFERK